MKRLLTIREVALFLCVCEQTVRSLVHQGVLQTVGKIGLGYKVREGDLHAWSGTTRDLLLVKEVAESLGVTELTVYKYVSSGRLGALRFGRTIRIREGDVDNLLSKGAENATAGGQ